jgi:hypothetical protein
MQASELSKGWNLQLLQKDSNLIIKSINNYILGTEESGFVFPAPLSHFRISGVLGFVCMDLGVPTLNMPGMQRYDAGNQIDEGSGDGSDKA